MLEMPKLNKEELRKEFSKDPKSYYSTKTFEEEGFTRKKCKVCGKNFWSIGERDKCEDPEHTEYSFFKDNPKPIGYKAFWDKFASFFEKNGHKVIARYPVVSRWRQDLYFTIASIQDFQRIENGAMSFEYNANPLIVPQICLRFSDIENVGVTGRHFTSFMMAGQHAFDYPDKGYWRDETIRLNYEFLTRILGVKKENLVYNEDVWAMGDFSEFGPCLESFSNGSELVNSVFTQFESAGGKIRELKGKVVDVGWGFERLLWFYTGFYNAYEAVFYDIIKKLEPNLGFEMDRALFKRFAELSSELDVTEGKGAKEKEQQILKKAKISQKEFEEKVKPMQALYATLDHTRTLLFAIADGSMPSNVGGGYNLRIILRRALNFMEEYKLNADMGMLAGMIAEDLKGIYPELNENIETFNEIIKIESERFEKTRENARKTVEILISKEQKVSGKELRVLYESNGITPELIAAVAYKKGVRLELPESTYEDIVKGDFAEKEKKGKFEFLAEKEFPKTGQLYYQFQTDSKSKVLYSGNRYVVLDKTPFYPEGGGQAADHGAINGKRVADVQKVGDVIVHVMEKPLAEGEIKADGYVECNVDRERRERLMVHHTATHMVNAASRSVLGKHAWQEGTKKEADKAHIDITHWEKLTENEIRQIENFVNSHVLEGIRVEIKEMDRSEAESKYGFSIYQGHGVPSKKMRMVIIKDLNGNEIDAEACGGLHVAGRESAIGIVKIIGAYRIHDGVDRLEYVAGKAALEYFGKENAALVRASQVLNSEPFSMPERAEKLRRENAEMMKRIRQKDEEYGNMLAELIYAEIKDKKGKVAMQKDAPREAMRMALGKIVAKNQEITLILSNSSGEVVCMAGKLSHKGALEAVKSEFGESFKGGGSRDVAEGILRS
ncbi:MAG: alanine--tRNA ligase [Candidatus Marsarchaeota archaeon]|nr:alanine--tRNA ligase [Candidatus Marsarchaeota archaeon]